MVSVGREIDLSRWLATGRPDRLDLAAVEAVMIWPDDDVARAKFLEAAVAKYSVDLIEKDEPVFCGSEISIITKWLLDAPPPSEFSAVEREARVYGLIAAEILLSGISDKPLTNIKNDISRKLQTKYNRGYSVSMIDNQIWPRFRPVSHLWAAAWMTRNESSPAASGHFFTVDRLPRFLSVAENFRKLGEFTIPRMSHFSMIDSATSWRVPHGILLPDVL